MRKRIRPSSDSSITSFRRAKLTRAALTTERSLAIASSRRTKPWSSTRIVVSGMTSAVAATRASVPGLHVGTSGFSYTSWRVGFYPADARPRDFLRLYAEHLQSVELNTSFYDLPAEEQFGRWAAQTPAGFRFAVKMTRRITHLGRLESLPDFCARVRALGDRLGPILVQFPPTRPRDDGFLRLFLDSLDPDLDYAFEFRHPSWEVDDVLAAASVARVGSLEGGAPFRYFRLRDPPYDDEELARWAARFCRLAASGIAVYAYFKHEDEPSAPAYARRLLELARAEKTGAGRPRFRPRPARNPSPRRRKEARMADDEERDPEEALAEIGEKRREGEEPSSEEREFLEAERVPTDPDETSDPSDEGRGTPAY
jgi:uncharacterized protein YecE (DUF72 family)